MFRWYQNAQVCYAFLDDVDRVEDLTGSLWFTRGWTLQELIGPRNLRFYSSTWDYLGSKLELASQLHIATGIEERVLLTGIFSDIRIAGRMRWAARRVTTRVEDSAYCLLGIFDVNMPLIYGEGKKAFIRLQQEIMKINSDDQSLFAWGLPENIQSLEDYAKEPRDASKLQGLFAATPSDFLTRHDIHEVGSRDPLPLPVTQHGGLRVQFPVLELPWISVLILSCTVYVDSKGFTSYLGIPIREWNLPYWARYELLILVPVQELEKSLPKSTIVKEPTPIHFDRRPKSFTFVRMQENKASEDSFLIDEIYCLPHAKYSQDERRMSFPVDHQGPHGAIFFTPNLGKKLGWRQNVKVKLKEVPFAIVLSMGRYPQYAFVPLLDPESGGIFRKIWQENPNNYMTKEQLKKRLIENPDWEFLWHRDPQTDDRALREWRQIREGAQVGETEKSDWELRLYVSFHDGPLDLMENTTYVFLQLRNRLTGMKNSLKLAGAYNEGLRIIAENDCKEGDVRYYNGIKDCLRTWWKMKEREWFEERG